MVLLKSLELEYGKALTDYNLVDTVSGTMFSEKNLSKEIVVVAFICNHCPYVVRIIDEFSKLALKTKDQVDWIAISANDPDYRAEDSPENMKLFAKTHKFSFPYLFDEDQEVARSFGAVCTPDIFVFKYRHPEEGEARRQDPVYCTSNYKLSYHARFEDLEKAIADLASADKISFEALASAGCSIKWRD